MKTWRCGQCGRRRPVKKMVTDTVWWWRSCRDEESCRRAFFRMGAQVNRQDVGSDNPYRRWQAGYWLRRHRRSAPRHGLDWSGEQGVET